MAEEILPEISSFLNIVQKLLLGFTPDSRAFLIQGIFLGQFCADQKFRHLMELRQSDSVHAPTPHRTELRYWMWCWCCGSAYVINCKIFRSKNVDYFEIDWIRIFINEHLILDRLC